MRRVEITSLLPVAAREDLEHITYFNPEQARVADSLVKVVHDYGVPTIFEDNGQLRFRVKAFGPVQALFALDRTLIIDELAGVVIFVRDAADDILVLHMAVHEDYAAHGQHADAWVAPRLMAAVRAVALHTRGVRSLRFLYPHRALLDVEHAVADHEVANTPGN